jgi:hypothetical protein
VLSRLSRDTSYCSVRFGSDRYQEFIRRVTLAFEALGIDVEKHLGVSKETNPGIAPEE